MFANTVAIDDYALTHASNSPKPPPHYGFIDALRGVAFLAVLGFHVSQRVEGLPTLLADVLGRGFAGVQLFFVVSAFTLCVSMTARAGEPRPLAAYFLRRAFRIVPMFWCAIALYLALTGFGPHWGVPDGLHVWQVLLAALLLHGFDLHALNGVVPGGWSVATEAQFYLLLPLMLRGASTLRRTVILLLGTVALSIATMPALGALLGPFFPGQGDLVHQFAFFSLPTQLPVFATGLVLYRLLGPDRAALARVEQFLPSNPRRRALLVLCVVLVIALPLRLTSLPLALVHGLPGHLGYGVAFALLAYALWTYPLAVVVNPVTQYLGKISYSGYLLHFAGARRGQRRHRPLDEQFPYAAPGDPRRVGSSSDDCGRYRDPCNGREARHCARPQAYHQFLCSTRRRLVDWWTFLRPDAIQIAARTRARHP